MNVFDQIKVFESSVRADIRCTCHRFLVRVAGSAAIPGCRPLLQRSNCGGRRLIVMKGVQIHEDHVSALKAKGKSLANGPYC